MLYAGSPPIEVHVLQDHELVIREWFPDEWVATKWAGEYGQRPERQGWRSSPERSTPSFGGLID